MQSEPATVPPELARSLNHEEFPSHHLVRRAILIRGEVFACGSK